MILYLEIKNFQVTLALKKGSKIIDKLSWKDNKSLLEKLLPSIDTLLVRNGKTVRDLKDVKSKIDTNRSFSASRIAMATVETLKFCISVDRSS